MEDAARGHRLDRDHPQSRLRRCRCCSAREWILGLFHIPAEPARSGRASPGLLLGILSVFYIPATLDIDRYRVFAWLAVFPSRTFGSVFFFLAVFVFGQPLGFLAGVLLDGSIGIATLWCLIRIVASRAGDRRGEARFEAALLAILLGVLIALVVVGAGGVSPAAAPGGAAGDQRPRAGLQPRLHRQRGDAGTALLDLAGAAADLPRTSARATGTAMALSASSGRAGEPVPVGFSVKTLGVIPRVAPNCAFCHQGSYRLRPARSGPAGQRRARHADRSAGLSSASSSAPAPIRASPPIRSWREIKAIYDMPLWERADLSLPADPGDAQGAQGAGAALRLDGEPAGLGTRTDRSVQPGEVPESRPARRRHDRQFRHDAALAAGRTRGNQYAPVLPALGRAADGPPRDGGVRRDRRRDDLQVVSAHQGDARQR